MKIETVTVLGANGTMGKNVAGIFASFGDAKVYMVARSLQDAKNAKKAAASSVRAETIEHNLIPRSYDDIAECVSESDLIFESVAENFTTKSSIYKMIIDFIKPGAIIGTGTSGLSINDLSEYFNAEQRKNYLGIHMYNPPYNMSLCELVPSESTDANVLFIVKHYLSDVLLRDVVVIKDQPAFMGNRIGFQFINEALQLAENHKDEGGIDYIDAIFGGHTGRSMAPLVTSDFVGLDVHKAIVDNVYHNTNDYAHEAFVLPAFAEKLISENKLGRKTGEGLYRRVVDEDGRKSIEVYDIKTDSFRPKKKYSFDFVNTMRKQLQTGKYTSAIATLLKDQSKEAKICLKSMLKYTLYSLHVNQEIGENIHSADHVMATGFNWIPPLAIVDAINEVDSFSSVVRHNFSQTYLDEMNVESLVSSLEKSSYDYRPYFKAN